MSFWLSGLKKQDGTSAFPTNYSRTSGRGIREYQLMFKNCKILRVKF